MQNGMTFSSLHSSLKKEESKKKNKLNKEKVFGFLTSMKFLAFVIIVLQIVIIFFLINPINLANQLNSVQIMNKVAKLTSVPPTEVPVFGVIGDNKVLPSADTLRKENDFEAQVYKDAQDGDYVLGYTSKMIVYRDSTNKIIYDGDSPLTLQNKSQKTIVNGIISKAKELGIIDQNSNETPQATVISDVDSYKKVNAEFYADAQVNDVVAIFSNVGKILVYRPSSGNIIKYGDYQFTVK